MKKFFAAVVAMLCTVSVWAEPTVLNRRSDWSKHKFLSVNNDGIMEFRGGRVDVFSTPFTIEPGKTYKFSMEVRTKPGTVSGVAYIGNWSMTEKNFRLLPEHVLAVADSDSTVVADAAAGSKIVVIRKPACWSDKGLHRTWTLAFNTRPDRSDLPNVSSIGIAKAEVNGDQLTLTLRNPLKSAVKAGTNVRFNRASSGMYGGLSNVRVGEEWQLVAWTVAGVAAESTNPADKWWNGAAKGAIRIIANYKHEKNAILQVRNVTMEVVE
ncbi:MAG: hypothetical protein E7047_01900 [Lentisphaerae bacterium]|nr:hypothetical protein [Lentisphaerota bacterium]